MLGRRSAEIEDYMNKKPFTLDNVSKLAKEANEQLEAAIDAAGRGQGEPHAGERQYHGSTGRPQRSTDSVALAV
jgi:hypothetical protein